MNPRSEAERVVVTGIGMVTPLGHGSQATWDAALAGRCAIGPITRFDASTFPVTFAAEIQDPQHAHLPGFKDRLALAAADEAIRMAGGVKAGPRLGVCLGSEAARPAVDELARRLATGSVPTALELEAMAPYAPTRAIARKWGAQGPSSTISTACTSSSQAIGEGMLRVRRGEVDTMIVGGTDVLVDPLMVIGFALLGALSTRNDEPQRASRPFDRNRDGFVLGEGAGVLVIESLAHARARGAEVLAELTGFGCSCNAWRITDSPPDGRGASQSMTAALADARLSREQVGYINAHGTSTGQNDASETAGIHRTFGDWRPAVSSTKSMMGHLVAACGAVEVILSLLAVRHGVLPPTINLDDPDPNCDLNHVALQPRETRVDHAISNAFGFGGSNGSIVVSRFTA